MAFSSPKPHSIAFICLLWHLPCCILNYICFHLFYHDGISGQTSTTCQQTEGNEAEIRGESGIRYWRVIIKMQNYTHVPFMEAELKVWLMEQDTLNPYRPYVKIKVQGETWGHNGRKLIKRHTWEVTVVFTYSMQIYCRWWTPITIFSSLSDVQDLSYFCQS